MIKLISPDVVHKSDVGGVVLNVIDEAGVREACASIPERVEAHPLLDGARGGGRCSTAQSPRSCCRV